jgi:hypothetical protein
MYGFRARASVRDDCAKQRSVRTSARNRDECADELVFLGFAPDDRVSQTEPAIVAAGGVRSTSRRDLVSTKADEQDAGATHGSERTTEHEGQAVAEAASESPQALPSIIVDPGLSELANAPAIEGAAPQVTAPSSNGAGAAHADEPAAAAPATNGAGHATTNESTSDDANGGMRFSDEDADRFAANFRPSWEPVEPANAPADSAVRTSLPALGPAVVVLPEPDLPVGAFSAADQRKRGLLMAGAAVAGFFVLVGLALSMSNREMPNAPHAAAAPPKTQVTAPSTAPEIAAPETTNVAPEAPSAAAAPADLRAAPPEPAAPPEEAPAEVAANEATAANPAPSAAEPEAPSTPEPAAPTPAAAPEPQPVAVAPAAPPPAKEVHVRVTATPGSAHILLDGQAVSNPYDAHAPAGERHRLQVEAPGHNARDITIGFERDQKLTIKLERARPPVAARPAAPARPAAARAQAPARSTTPQVASSTMTITPRPAPAAPKPSGAKGAGFVNESPY